MLKGQPNPPPPPIRSWLILFTLMMEAIRHIPEDGILHIHQRENHKSYILGIIVIVNHLFLHISNSSRLKMSAADQRAH
jgi:hypothetical protein